MGEEGGGGWEKKNEQFLYHPLISSTIYIMK